MAKKNKTIIISTVLILISAFLLLSYFQVISFGPFDIIGQGSGDITGISNCADYDGTTNVLYPNQERFGCYAWTGETNNLICKCAIRDITYSEGTFENDDNPRADEIDYLETTLVCPSGYNKVQTSTGGFKCTRTVVCDDCVEPDDCRYTGCRDGYSCSVNSGQYSCSQTGASPNWLLWGGIIAGILVILLLFGLLLVK